MLNLVNDTVTQLKPFWRVLMESLLEAEFTALIIQLKQRNPMLMFLGMLYFSAAVFEAED
jgi:hypothetical protein